MRVTIHRPLLLVEEYDVPDKLAAGDDDAILGATRRRAPVSSVRQDHGDPVVYSRGADPLEEAAQRLADARARLDDARESAKAAAVAAADAGASEHALAKQLGVDRLTIRAWRGKGRAT